MKSKSQTECYVNTQYDVIVVGAGNGGMVAAATTAKNGFKTLLLEKNNTPGGSASSFVRGRFEFEPSLHELCAVGTKENPGTIYSLFDELGAKVNWEYDDYLFRAIVKGENGYDARIKSGIEDFCDSMEKAVPGCRQSVHSLFDVIRQNEEALAYNDKKNGNPNKLTMVSKYATFLKTAAHSAEALMTSLGIPKKAQNIISTYWSYLGVPTDEMSALHYFLMVNGYIQEKAAVPPFRSHELSVALIDVLLKNGGQIWYNSEVTEFIFNQKGKVCGVIANGQKLYAKQVISNIIPNNVYNRSEYVFLPKKAIKLTNARSFGLSIYCAYIGLDCSMEELGIEDYTVFVSDSPNPREQFKNLKNGNTYIVNCLNKILPNSSPEGTCTMFFSIPALGSDFPKDLKPQDYKHFKSNLIRKYIEDYQQLMHIDILSHIEEIEIATPASFARYLGTPEGTIYGYHLSYWDSMISRFTAKQKNISIPGLTFCGGHTAQGDGFSTSYTSGRTAAQIAMKNIRKDQ